MGKKISSEMDRNSGCNSEKEACCIVRFLFFCYWSEWFLLVFFFLFLWLLPYVLCILVEEDKKVTFLSISHLFFLFFYEKSAYLNNFCYVLFGVYFVCFWIDFIYYSSLLFLFCCYFFIINTCVSVFKLFKFFCWFLFCFCFTFVFACALRFLCVKLVFVCLFIFVCFADMFFVLIFVWHWY